METQKSSFKINFLRIFLILYAGLFVIFYYRYVPLVPGFQIVLVPILAVALILTLCSHQWGLLFFVFAFPLINNLPYLFHIYLETPHAPTALVLFLVFFWGWLFRYVFSQQRWSHQHRIFRPLTLFAMLVLLSGVITLFRFINFVPFLSSSFRDVVVNVYGVRAGGAVMSTIFSGMNYFSGFLFFLVVFNTTRSREYIARILGVLSLSAFLTFLFGFVQNYHSLRFGNSPFFVNMGRINSTLKDPNSFGLFVAAFIPMLLGLGISDKKRRPLWGILLVLALVIFPPIGSRSAMLGLGLGLVFFLFLSLITAKISPKKRWTYLVLIVILFCVVTGIFMMVAKGSNLYLRIQQNLSLVFKPSSLSQVVDVGRMEFWRTALELVRTYPLSGVGLGAYIIELPNFTKLRGYAAGHTDSAENYFLQISSELGLAGLLVALWFLFEVLRMVRASRRNLGDNDPDRFILFGLISALVIVFVNLFFHSYIGAFDVKYFAWLLVGLVCLFPELKTQTQAAVSPCKSRMRIWAMAVLIGFAAVQLWTSTHSLSLAQTTLRFDLEQNFGLYSDEEDGQGTRFNWTHQEAGISFKNTRRTVVIPLRAAHPGIDRYPVKVRIFRTGPVFSHAELIEEIELTSAQWYLYEYSPGTLSDSRV
ncbi:MAG: hypothetical protein GQ544_00575, partial [Candidatus Aminicenantes bacterium]|nr:hypothetical protein [Candidatus Aminicenantes bacterium]